MSSITSSDSLSHKSRLNKRQINSKAERTFIQRRSKANRHINYDNDAKTYFPSIKDINHDSIILNKNMIEGYVLESKIAPYAPTLVTRYRAMNNTTKSKVIIKHCPYSLGQTSPLSKFLNEWYILSGINPKSPKDSWMDSISNFAIKSPVTLPKDIKGILYPVDFFYSVLNGGSGLIYSNELGLCNLKEKFIIAKQESPKFLTERSPSSSSLKSFQSNHGLDASKKVVYKSAEEIIQILEIIIKVLKTLKLVHDLGFTNNGLTTLSIFVDHNGQNVFIEGWDFAFSRTSESCTKGYRATNKDLINWLLPYTSPEATGSFNKLCDYRSDFYSIGIILYELLVGFLPFQSSESTKVIHLHLFQNPVAPYVITSWISERLSNVIMTCLEKFAINRFNDCNEMINELTLCIDELSEEPVRDPNYPYKVNPRFLSPKNTYNRKDDMNKLKETYESIQSGVASIYITGEKGAGKSSILGDFKTYLVGRRGMLYLEWHHEKFRNTDSTYNMFISIIRQVLQQILGSHQKVVKKWRDLIVRKINDDLSIVAETFPELKLLMGEKHLAITKEVQFVGESQLEVLPAKFESRFEYIIKVFFSMFASYSTEGLTLIMDDDQFQHHNARYLLGDIISYMLNHNRSKNPARMRIISSLMVGDGARGSYKAFTSLDAKNFKLEGSRNFFIELSPLTYEAVQHFVSDFLPLSDFPMQDHISKLIYDGFLYQKTPLVLRHTLSRLAMTGSFEVHKGKLIFNFKNATKLLPPSSLTDYYNGHCKDIIEKDETNILKFAACVCSGYSFSLQLLSVVAGLSIADTYILIFPAINSGLISPLGIDYKVPFHLFNSQFPLAHIPEQRITQMASTCLFEFSHDTLQDYILSDLMTSDELQRYHKMCALRLYEKIENLEDLNYSRLIYVTRHFVESIDVATEEEDEIYSEVLISGGKLAYDNFDFQLALFYFQAAKRFSQSGSDEEEVSQMSKTIDLTIVQLEFILGNYKDCLTMIDEFVPVYEKPIDKISFLLTKLKSLFSLNMNVEGITVVLDSLKVLGIHIEEDEDWNREYHESLRPRIPLSVNEIRSLVATRANADDSDDLIKAELISNVLIPIMATRRPHLTKTLIYTGIIDIIENGCLPSHSLILLILSLELFKEEGEASFMRAIEYTDAALKLIQDGDTSMDLGTSIYEIYCCTMAIYAEPLEIVSKYYDVFISSNRAFTDSFVELDSFLLIGIKNVSKVISGAENLNSILLKNANLSLESNLTLNYESNEDWTNLSLNFLRCLTGTVSVDNFQKVDMQDKNFIVKDEYNYVYHVMKFSILYLVGDFQNALTILFDMLPTFDYLFPITCYKILVVYFGALLILRAPGDTAKEKLRRAKLLEEYIKYLEVWSNSCPSNFEIKFLLVKAVLKSKLSNHANVDTLDMFEMVIEKAAQKGQLLDEALAYEFCSIWLLETSSGKNRASKFMKEAVRVYNLWGCSTKVAKLSEEYHDLVHDYNWAGVDILSPSSDHNSPSSVGKSSAPFQLLLSNFFKNNDQALHTSSSDENEDLLLDEGDGKNGKRRTSSESTMVDMRTALSTCLEISEAVDFATIVTKLVENTLQLTDSDFAVVCTKDRVGDLYLECAASNKVVRLIEHEPLNSRNDICPINLIRDTFNKGRIINREDDPIFFDNTYTDQDYYYQSGQVSAAVCIPIRDQNEVIGTLYLENQHHTRSRSKCFNSEKIDITVLFCTQLAFSLYKATLYQQMNIATTLAKAATEEKANFLNSMSHEIRTPFNSLLSCALFLLDTELTDVQRDYVETIKSSSMVTLSIIDGILSFAKIENSSVTLDETPFSINDSIESAMQLVSEQAATKNLELVHLNHCDDIDTIFGDITRFRQVIVNIVGNAVKFTSSGHILVETKCHQVSLDNRYEFNITVSDTGIGIPLDSHNKVFGAFSQVDGSARRVYGGAGLGLAISKKIVDIMGGSLTFESEENKGATFTFSVIVKLEANVKEVVNNFGKGQKILIADRHKLTRLSIAKEIDNYGFEIIETDNVDDLLQLVKSNKFSVVFIHGELITNLEEKRVEDMIKQEKQLRDTKFILMGKFGTIFRKKFDRILLLPFLKLKIYEIISPQKTPTAIKGGKAPLTKESMATLAESHPLTILLAEDNMINTKVTLQHLKRMGYEADHASDGLILLTKCAEKILKSGKNYDVVLMDIQMPNMDGIESCTKIMELYEEGSNLRPQVILLTANVVGEDRQRCSACGMSNFISKPLLPNDLAQLLLRVEVKA